MAGQVKVNSIQIGDDATDTRNFLLRTLVDGTLKLSRGALGALADLMTFDVNGKVAFPSGFGAGNTNQSCIRVNTSNGYGSTNTKIRRYTNVVLNQGTDISYTDSAVLGALFTINTAGVYAISITEISVGATFFGVSLNTVAPTTSIGGIAQTEVLAASGAGAGVAGNASVVVYLPAGSLVRPHTDGAASTGTLQFFTITRVS